MQPLNPATAPLRAVSIISPTPHESVAGSPASARSNQQVAATVPTTSNRPATTEELLAAESANQLEAHQKFNQKQMGSLICAVSAITIGTAILFVAHYATFNKTVGHVLFPMGILCQGIGVREIVSLALRTRKQQQVDLQHMHELRIQHMRRAAVKPEVVAQPSEEQFAILQRDLAQSRATNHSLLAKIQRRERLITLQQNTVAQLTQKGDDPTRMSPLALKVPESRGPSMSSSQGELRPLLGITAKGESLAKGASSSEDPDRPVEKGSTSEIDPQWRLGSSTTFPFRFSKSPARSELQQISIEDSQSPLTEQIPISSTVRSDSLKTLSAADRQLLENLDLKGPGKTKSIPGPLSVDQALPVS